MDKNTRIRLIMLKYEMEMNGMIAENKWREQVDRQIAYGEDAFALTSDRMCREIAEEEGKQDGEMDTL